MGRYLLFAGPQFYAHGGWLDFKGSYESAEAAAERGVKMVSADCFSDDYADWWQVVDAVNQKLVAQAERQAH